MKLISGLIAIFYSAFSFSQNADSYKNYLKENVAVYDENSGIMPDADYSNYRLFVTGEYHFKAENSKIFLSVFRNLYYNANVRLILFEAGYAYGLIAQNYLETGSYESLKKVSEEGQFNELHYRFLKDFYDKLPDDDKFIIVGIDLDSYTIRSSFRYAVDLLFRDTLMPEELTSLLDEFEDVTDSEKYTTIQSSFDDIYSNYKSNKDAYKLLLPNRYEDYSELIERTRKSLRFDEYNYNYGKDSTEQTKRENYIFKNAAATINKYPDCNYFGQFGLAHIGLSRFLVMDEESGVESFTAKLNSYKNSPVRDSICSIAILYFDKYYGDYSKLSYYMREWNYNMSLRKILPLKFYKAIKNSVDEHKLYYVNIAKQQSPLQEFAMKNFQYLIFKR